VRADAAALLALGWHPGRHGHEALVAIVKLAAAACSSPRGPAKLPAGSRLGCADWLHAAWFMLRPAPGCGTGLSEDLREAGQLLSRGEALAIVRGRTNCMIPHPITLIRK
jgi:hypothetical protein